MAFIDIDFGDTIGKAEQIKEKAEEINSISCANLGQDFDRLASAWKGDSGELYISKALKINRTIANKSDELKKTAEALKGKAERLRKVEELGVSIFSS